MATKREYHGNIRAPEFPPDVTWLNTGRRLTLVQLRGKFVLLDFWTYGCINCIHIIPDLKRLEALYPHTLIVIGVHSAKFANEGDTVNLRQIVLRYELEHPIINDKDFRVWSAYAVRAWPTTVLIDPRGYVLASHSGEGVLDAYHALLSAAMQRYEAEGLLDHTPLSLVLEQSGAEAATSRPETPLSFPGKVLADEGVNGRLFIADSNHHRIVVTDLDGWVRDVIGSGIRGLVDGPFGEAQFAKLQGLALDGDQLYVADTENHALRVVDLKTRAVRTLAGDGTLGRGRTERGVAAHVQLNSPWDLALVGRDLYIAMAGLHQIWKLDLDQGLIGPYAGSGRESLLDGPAPQAALAQPSGLATDGQILYFADSEASAVRVVDLGSARQVKTLIGEGLFDFGDVDGTWPAARLQHALGITCYQGKLYVADTYNHKIKILDPQQGHIATLAGSGTPGWRDGSPSQFYEPGGLSGARNKLYVADTNNHVIRTVDLQSLAVGTLALQDPQGLLSAPASTDGVLHLPAQQVRPGEGVLLVNVQLPEGFRINAEAPSLLIWQPSSDGVVELAQEQQKASLADRAWPIRLAAIFREGQTPLRGELTLYYCATDSESVCLVWRTRLELPILVSVQAPQHEVEVTLQVDPPTAPSN